MTATMYIGDAIEVMGKLPEKSVDLILTSPPFLALRSYLPQDHPDKALEGGSQATPGAFIDWLVDVVEACDRVLAPHGSMCIELGDTYAGSGGAGGDYNEHGIRAGQPRWDGSVRLGHGVYVEGKGRLQAGPAWPLAKSLSLIPELFRLTLVYGTNPLTGRQTDRWRLRNVVRWVRPNPPVGALGDKFRPATSELMVFCKSAKRYFDLDAVREAPSPGTKRRNAIGVESRPNTVPSAYRDRTNFSTLPINDTPHPLGAPPLDWWNIPPGGYSGTVMWTARKPVDPRESVGDIWRTTSADCPVHADQPDQAPTAPHDEPVSEDHPDRNHGKGANPAPKPLPGSAPIDPLPWPNPEGGTLDSLLPDSKPAATRRSKASNRTALVPATSPPDNASDRTAGRTGDTSTALLSDEPHPDSPENRTSGVCRHGCTQGTCDHNFDRSSEGFDEACTCSYWVAESQSTSHYAVFPPELCIKPIKAMSPEKVCRQCGEPSRRITDVSYSHDASHANGAFVGESYGVNAPAKVQPGPQGMAHGRATKNVETLGWSDCGCCGRDPSTSARLEGSGSGTTTRGRNARDSYPLDASYCTDQSHWRPGVVLDPFVGSGTTLMVATGHGRDAIGIDLDARNYDLALQRVGPFILERAG